MSAIRENTQNNTIDLNGSMIHFTDLGKLSELLIKKYCFSENDFVLADSNTARHCFPLIKSILINIDEDRLITIDPGEAEKNISTLQHIWSSLQEKGADRDSRLFNLGGGIITDIGGFAASTYKRGIDFIHIPTSLMGMADAAIGGKTAVNLGEIKNQLGMFALPKAVLIYPGFLETLPWDELLSGYAELIKISLAFDSSLWESLQDIRFTEPDKDKITKQLYESILLKAVSLKAGVAEKDLYDRAERQCLNFGHSVGHALEAFHLSSGAEIKHGIAIAAGMICEAYISGRLAGLDNREENIITDYILEYFPKVRFEEKDIDEIIIMMRHDKKSRDKNILMSLLRAPGTCNYGVKCPEEIIRDSLLHYLKLS